jgi:vancomycin resistance protein YoaR
VRARSGSFIYNPAMKESKQAQQQPPCRPLFGLRAMLQLGLVTALASVIAAGVIALGYQRAYAFHFYEGVGIGGIHIGGLSRSEAMELLQQRFAPAESPYVTLESASGVWTLSLSTLGGAFDLTPALQEAWRVGRQGSWRDRIADQARALWYGYNVVPALTLSHGQSVEPLRRIARQVAQPATSAGLRLAGLDVVSTSSESGRELDIPATRASIEHAVGEALGSSQWGHEPRLVAAEAWGPESGALLLPEPVRASLVFRDVAPSLSEIASAQARLDTLLASPLLLTMDLEEFDSRGYPYTVQHRCAIDQATLASWVRVSNIEEAERLRLRVALDEAALDAFLDEMAHAIARLPREGLFLYDPSSEEIEVLNPGQIGVALDVAAARAAILEACFDDDRVVELPIHQATPLVTAEELRAMLPLDLISVGESSFAGSTESRALNIHLAASQFDGVAVPGGAEFSFLRHLGPVNASTGYAESWVIFGDRTELGTGGGVCQVSTTCFRAAFWGGYPITARSPHAYRVSWYEPPLGLDAAVFAPTTDMRFQNDGDSPLLIMTAIDEETSTLTFSFYGRSRGREVRMVGPTVENTDQPGDPVEEIDASLPAGARILVERAREGLDVRVVRVVEQDGGVLSRDEFWSRYQAWPARYRVAPPQETATP